MPAGQSPIEPVDPIGAIVIGGGAAGFFGAITCAGAAPGTRVLLLERGSTTLGKVRISGGGRCNVTTATAEPRALSANYPRGGRTLIGPFTRFGPRETIAWFEGRGVRLKTEPDGRIFPVSNSSASIIGCLADAAAALGVQVRTGVEVRGIEADPAGSLRVHTADGTSVAGRVLLASGGCRGDGIVALLRATGHSVEPPVPSLFTFHVAAPWLTELAGISVGRVRVRIPGTKLESEGPMLITHNGLSGPVILKLSAWGARVLHDRDYCFDVEIDWVPGHSPPELDALLQTRALESGARKVEGTPFPPLPARLWEALCRESGISPETRWSTLTREHRATLGTRLRRTVLGVGGRSLNKEEFVTCGGVRLDEINFQTMESKLQPGLHFAGEILDIDGVTGGFNFQNAWTTSWLAGRAMAGS